MRSRVSIRRGSQWHQPPVHLAISRDVVCYTSLPKCTYRAGPNVAKHPQAEAVPRLVETEHLLVLILESKVECLRRKVAKHIGRVAPPKRHVSFLSHGATEAVNNATVPATQATGFNHLVLPHDEYTSESDCLHLHRRVESLSSRRECSLR